MRPLVLSHAAEGASGGAAALHTGRDRPASAGKGTYIRPLTVRSREGDVSPAVRRRFVKHVKQAQKALGALEKRTLKQAIATLEEARRRLIAALHGASEFQQWRLPQMIAAVNDEIRRLNGELTKVVMAGAEDAVALGVARVAGAAKSVGVNLAGVPIGTGGDALEIAQQIIPEMIQAESQAVVRRIGTQLRMAFAGGATRAEVVDQVSQTVTKTLRFGSFRDRAKTIVRTEINRTHNAAHDETISRLGASNVKVRKMWLSSQDPRVREEHRLMNGRITNADGKFEYPGLPEERWPRYPLDPILPPEASIQCRCTMSEIFEILDEDAAQIAEEASA